jgi:hypothetical protein
MTGAYGGSFKCKVWSSGFLAEKSKGNVTVLMSHVLFTLNVDFPWAANDDFPLSGPGQDRFVGLLWHDIANEKKAQMGLTHCSNSDLYTIAGSAKVINKGDEVKVLKFTMIGAFPLEGIVVECKLKLDRASTGDPGIGGCP